MLTKPYEQTTSESCLASCLLMLLDRNPTPDKELFILRNGLEFTKWNFVVGHLNYVAECYRRAMKWYIEFEKWFDFIKILKISPLVEVERTIIDKDFIDRIQRPVILYIDSFALHNDIHIPHAIVVSKENESYRIYDPWDGKSKLISTQTLLSGILDLRKRLNYSPQIITIE